MKAHRARCVQWLVGVLVFGWMLGLSGSLASATPALLDVTPNFGVVWGSSGSAGGPFAPSSITYTVINRGTDESMSWCATKTQPWLRLSTDCGVLAPGGTTTVTASIDQTVAATLAVDGYSEPILFTNLTNNRYVTSDGTVLMEPGRRFVTLNVLGDTGSPLQGFGAGTRGGAGGDVFRVTTLADNGDDANPVPGSLREAVSRRNRTILFDVGGTIALQTFLFVQADHVTIDGSSAPAPGITLTQYGIILRGNRGAHDIVVRGLRVRDIVRSPTPDTEFDGIQVANGAFNILIDHVSVQDANDGSIDITTSHDVTVSWSIIGPPTSGKNMLVKYDASRVSLHHNLFLDSGTRNPQIEHDDSSTPSPTVMVDMRNNLVWDFGVGTLVAKGARANVVSNYYSKASLALSVNGNARAYTSGNVVHGSLVNINGAGTEAAPFPAAPVTTTDAATAACQVRAAVGVRPLDAAEAALLAPVLDGVTGGPCLTVAVTKAGGGSGTVISSADLINCGSRCSALVDEGTSLTLTATPATGSTFSGFSGPADCADGSLTITAPVTCVATFERKNDLSISALTAPTGADPGSTIAVRHTTMNRTGTGPVGPTTTRIYLSRNTAIDASDVVLASVLVPALAAGQSSTTTTNVVVPAGTVPGTYFVVAQADALGASAEAFETNNTRSVRVIVGADLSIASIAAATTAAPGASITLTVVTANAAAAGPARESTTRVYLSRDLVPSPGEVVAEHRVGVLAAGARDTWRPTITVPASLAPGTYNLITRADDDREVPETVETNNGRSRVISIRP